MIIKPIWYGKLWGYASKSNTSLIQRSQFKLLRSIVSASLYVTNETIHIDLKIPTIGTVTMDSSTRHHLFPSLLRFYWLVMTEEIVYKSVTRMGRMNVMNYLKLITKQLIEYLIVLIVAIFK